MEATVSFMKKGLDYVFKSDSPKPHTAKLSNTRRHSGSEGGRRNSWFGSNRRTNDSTPSIPPLEHTNQNDDPRHRQEDRRSSLPVQSASGIASTNVERSQQGRASYAEALTSPPTKTRTASMVPLTPAAAESTGGALSRAENHAGITPAAPHPDLAKDSPGTPASQSTSSISAATERDGTTAAFPAQSSHSAPRVSPKPNSSHTSSRHPDHHKSDSHVSSSASERNSTRIQTKGQSSSSSGHSEVRRLQNVLESTIQAHDAEKQKWKNYLRQRVIPEQKALEQGLEQERQVRQRIEQEKKALEHSLHQEREDRQRLAHETRSQIAGLSSLNAQYAADIGRLQAALNAAHALSETRARELTSAKAFLAASDDSSGADVLKLVNSLNEQVFQLAAQVVDAVEYKEEKEIQTDEMKRQLEDAKQYLKGFLGDVVGLVAGSRLTDQVEYISQCAIQAVLLQYCTRIIHDWSWQPEVNAALHQIYTSIQQSTIQEPALRMISGRWRALTRAKSRSKWEEEPMQQNMVERVIDDVMKLLVLINGRLPFNSEEMEEKKAWAGGKVSEILQTASQLSVVIGEGITSVDYQVICPQPGDNFHPDFMVDDEEKDEGNDQHMKVLCPCQLGVFHTHTEVPNRLQTILKARVVLSSSVLA